MTAKTITAQEYLDAESAPAIAQYRKRMIAALRASSAPCEVIARVEYASDAKIEAMMMAAADSLPRDEHDEITRMATANIVTAIYSGDCEMAVWLRQLAAAKGEVSVREMLADFDASAVLEKARQVAHGSAN